MLQFRSKRKLEVKNIAIVKGMEGYESVYALNFTAFKIAKKLFSITLFLILAHCVSLFLFYTLPEQHLTLLLTRLFDLGKDYNVPNLFSAFLLLSASILLFYTYKQKMKELGKRTYHWLVLSLIFLYLTIDEATRIHEELMETTRSRLPMKLSGYLFIPWVIPYGIFTLIVVALFLRFVLRLPKRTRNLILISGFIYVIGAIGFEMLEGHELEQHGRNFLIHVFETIEETMEMSGVIIFIYALIDYLAPAGIKVDISYYKKRTGGITFK